MRLAPAYAGKSVDEIRAALAGAVLRVYAFPQPRTAEQPIIREGLLAEFTLGVPAFADQAIIAEPVAARMPGTPQFLRALTADGEVIGDFSAGPGDCDVKLASVSFFRDAPVRIVSFRVRFEAESGRLSLSRSAVSADNLGTAR